ncbi:MAG: hypothetical protein ACRD4M_09000 [Candidatus Acidiferrales bacterium]
MVGTSQYSTHESSAENLTRQFRRSSFLAHSGVNPHLPCPEESAATISALLALDTIELCRISDEIRLHSGLEAMVMRLSHSLLLSPDLPPSTVEGAAILLGVDRLRVLVHAWTLLELEKAGDAEDTDSNSRLYAEDFGRQNSLSCATPETLYLTTFLHLLGLDASTSQPYPHVSRFLLSTGDLEHVPVLTDILMRDFISLIPYLDATILRACRKSSSEIAAGVFQSET